MVKKYFYFTYYNRHQLFYTYGYTSDNNILYRYTLFITKATYFFTRRYYCTIRIIKNENRQGQKIKNISRRYNKIYQRSCERSFNYITYQIERKRIVILYYIPIFFSFGRLHYIYFDQYAFSLSF